MMIQPHMRVLTDSELEFYFRSALEGVLMEYNVESDMVWAGHHHSYQRTYRVFNGTCRGSSTDQHVRAPIHVTMGTGGTA